MKYRMQDGKLLRNGLPVVADSAASFYCTEAAVEFWQENERLLTALGKIVADLDELELQASIASDKARNSDACNYENGKQNAYEKAADMVREVIARAEQNGENEQ